MKALVCREFGPPENLVLEDRPSPEPGPGEVRVDLRAAGLNFPDLLVISGQYQVRTPPPFVPGSEAAGVVSALGEGVTRFKTGQRVIVTPTLGAFAEQVVAPEALCMPLPEAMSFEAGAAFTVTYATAFHAFRQCTELRAGETLLVLGAAGGVGTAAVEIGKALGARVIAAASGPDKLAFAKSVGADETIDYAETSLRDAIRERTDGHGVDVVFDPVGGELAQQALRGLAWQGRYLVVGFASGDIPAFPANLALLKEASIIGVWWGAWGKQQPDDALQNLAELAQWVEQRRLVPRVTKTYALDEYAQAFDAIRERRALGKLVFTMGAD